MRSWYRKRRTPQATTSEPSEQPTVADAPGDGQPGQVPTELLLANPTKYGYVGNGRMATPLEDWLALVEAFGPENVALYDQAGDTVDTSAQVAAILDDQVIGPILRADDQHP